MPTLRAALGTPGRAPSALVSAASASAHGIASFLGEGGQGDGHDAGDEAGAALLRSTGRALSAALSLVVDNLARQRGGQAPATKRSPVVGRFPE